MPSRTILKWTGVVTVLLVISRLLGFFREAAIGYRFGVSLETDAYMAAVVLPQILFLSFNDSIKTAFIPVYGEYHKQEEGKTLAATSFVILGLVLTAFTVLLVALAPLVTRLVAPGFAQDKYEVTVVMVRIMLPGLLFMGLSGLSSGVLHTKKNFVIPAIPAYSSNLIIIATAVFFGVRYGVVGLAWGTTLGFASQFLVQVPAVARHGVFQGKINWKHPGLKKMARVLPPILLGGAAIEFKTLVDRVFGSYLGDGPISALSFANRIYLLPNGILILALLTVIYPTLVELNVEGKFKEFKETFRGGMGMIVVLMLPIMTGMVILRVPIVRLLFERGEFTPEATAMTAYALAFYGISLTPLGIMLLAKRTFFAMKDTLTPMLFMIFTELLNILFNWLLVRTPLRHGGIALGTSLAVYVGAIGLTYLLWRRMGTFGGRRLFATFVKAGVATAVMGVTVFYGSRFLTGGSSLRQLIELGALIGLGAAVYFAVAFALKVEELDMGMRIVKRKIRR